jgi:hypothetical protein
MGKRCVQLTTGQFADFARVETKTILFFSLLEAGLFEIKIWICYACVHLGRFTKEISSSH